MRVARMDGLNRRATMSDHKTSKAVHCVVDYPRPPKASQFMKPVAMIADAIRDVPKQGNPVLDPFCDSGTILMQPRRPAAGYAPSRSIATIAMERFSAKRPSPARWLCLPRRPGPL